MAELARHIGLMTDQAAVEAGGRWPIELGDPRLVIQTAPTESFVGKTWRQRLDVANGPFREAVSMQTG